jgi:hypothetical protein
VARGIRARPGRVNQREGGWGHEGDGRGQWKRPFEFPILEPGFMGFRTTGRKDSMHVRYGLMIGCLLVGFVWSASAQQKYSDLIGDWLATGVPGCSPCQVSIQGVKDDGTLIVRSTMAGDYVESWGEAKRDGERIGIHLVMAGGSTFDLTLSKDGEFLQGFAESYSRDRRGMANLKRVKAQQ